MKFYEIYFWVEHLIKVLKINDFWMLLFKEKSNQIYLFELIFLLELKVWMSFALEMITWLIEQNETLVIIDFRPFLA